MKNKITQTILQGVPILGQSGLRLVTEHCSKKRGASFVELCEHLMRGEGRQGGRLDLAVSSSQVHLNRVHIDLLSAYPIRQAVVHVPLNVGHVGSAALRK